MALHLTVGKGDKITLHDKHNNVGIVIDVTPNGKGKFKLSFTAPDFVEIYTIFADSSQQFKNQRRDDV